MTNSDPFALPKSISTTDVYQPGSSNSSFDAAQAEIDRMSWTGSAYQGDSLDTDNGPLRNQRKG